MVSKDFGETAETLRDCLVQSSGFNRQEASEFVAARRPEQAKLDLKRGGLFPLVHGIRALALE